MTRRDGTHRAARLTVAALLFALALCFGCQTAAAPVPGADPAPLGGDYAGLTIAEAVRREAEARGISLSAAEEAETAAWGQQDFDELTKLGELGTDTLESLTDAHRTELLTEKLTAALFPNVQVSEAEAREWYDARYEALSKVFAQNPGVFKSQQDLYDAYGGVPPLLVPEGFVRFQHILVSERSEAEAILSRLAAGEDFAALMEQYGQDAGMRAEPFRTLGYLTGPYPSTQDYLEPLKNAALALENVGEISGIVESEAGFHIVRLSEKLSAGEKRFDEVKDAITALLSSYRAAQRMQALLTSWTTAAG